MKKNNKHDSKEIIDVTEKKNKEKLKSKKDKNNDIYDYEENNDIDELDNYTDNTDELDLLERIKEEKKDKNIEEETSIKEKKKFSLFKKKDKSDNKSDDQEPKKKKINFFKKKEKDTGNEEETSIKEKKKLSLFKKKDKKEKKIYDQEIDEEITDIENIEIKEDKPAKKFKKFLFFKPKTNKEKHNKKNKDKKLADSEEEEFISTKGEFKNKKKNSKKKVKTKDKIEKKKKRSFWKRLVTFILIMCIVGILLLAAFLTYIVITAPEFNESQMSMQDQTVVYDIDGRVIATLGVEKRESVTYDQLPQVLIDAIIATEDSRFFQHNGVDLFRFIKATVQQLLGQGDAGGASTLTMQTVKNNVTKKDKSEDNKIQKVIRKFQDVYISVFKVEKEYSKEEILELYVNDNYLGGPSIYGVEEASKYYFGKSVSDISLPEASIIAGLFQLPGRYNPYVHPEDTTKRRNLVLRYMYNHGYITKEEMEAVKRIPVESLLVGANSDNNKYQGFVDTAVAEIEKKTGDNPYVTPMLIYTTMERSAQDTVNGIYTTPTGGYYMGMQMWKDDKSQAGVAIVNSETGGIAAIGARRDNTGVNQWNYATQAKRQPGSTSKPLFDYGPAIEYNNFSSYTLINDEPWSYTNGPVVNNWDGGHHGLRTIRYHLQVSRNVPALKTFQTVGGTNSQKFVSALGLNVSLNANSDNYEVFDNGIDNTINEAYSIGGSAEGFTPLEMAGAYACFSNGGYYIEPHSVTKIVYRDTGEEKEFKYTKERVMKDSTAYIMNNILESAVTSGFPGGARISGSHVAAKTGTSNYDEATMRAKHMPGGAVNDLWTVAYTSKYAVAVWFGYDEADSTYYNDSDFWKNNITTASMVAIPKDTVGWSMPSSVVAVTVERDTWPAQLPSQYTPGNMRVTEYFVRGTQPGEVSPRYQQVNDVKEVKTKNNSDNSVTITWDFTEPAVVTRGYLEKYFNNSVYGNQKNMYLERRLGCINNDDCTLGDGTKTGGMGGLGFGIYKLGTDGKYTRIDFTKEKTYTYKGYGKTELLIKAEYKNFKENASNGIKVTVSLDELSNDKLSATLDGINKVEAQVGSYNEKGIKKVTYGLLDVTTSNLTKIEYTITTESETKKFNTMSELENYVNTLSAGEYIINYNISYSGISITKTRTVTLK